MSEKSGVWAWWSWEMCLEKIKDEKDVYNFKDTRQGGLGSLRYDLAVTNRKSCHVLNGRHDGYRYKRSNSFRTIFTETAT
jgi:hypothetical protein